MKNSIITLKTAIIALNLYLYHDFYTLKMLSQQSNVQNLSVVITCSVSSAIINEALKHLSCIFKKLQAALITAADTSGSLYSLPTKLYLSTRF